MLLELFINAGWWTVPLKGKLERLESGKKSLPIFEEGWKAKYSETFNKEIVPLAGALTGSKSGIIAIDCDNDITYQMFKSMDKDYTFHFVSKGKPQGGGTIIYKYTNQIGSFKLNTDTIALDFYADEGFIYLPTEHNHSKESWQDVSELPCLKELPPVILSILQTFKSKVAPVEKKTDSKHTISNRLAPMLEVFVKKKEYDPILFKVITPYSFRDLPNYSNKGHLHPNDVPRGRGSEYLSKVSAILGADISVNKELYMNSITLINELWKGIHRPKEKNELMSTIINPMIEEKAQIDGKVIWEYDPHWEKMGFIATTINGDYIESFYDDVKGLYYLINYTVPYIRSYSDKRPVITTLRTLLGRTITDQQYDSIKQLIRTQLSPHLEFGHIEGGDKYNLFKQTPYLEVMNNPEIHRVKYCRPKHIIKYFESLIPDDVMRDYTLRFIKTKFTTFKYSPVVLYLIGKSGSGKDTFVSIIRTIVGADYVAKPDTKVFLEPYNGWMIDKYFIQLDEYGNKLTQFSEKQVALGKIKAYTGSKELQIRAMRTDGYNYLHSTTFLMTANLNPLPIETEDRRVAFIKTPNKLRDEEWVKEAGGISQVVEKLIPSEIMDFCYYLATEVKSLTSDEYGEAPLTKDKEKLILDGLPAVEQIAYYLANDRFDLLLGLADEYGVNGISDDWEKGRILDDKLQELYSAMTDGQGVSRTLVKKLKDNGIPRSHTTRRGTNVFYYYRGNIHKHKPRTAHDDNAGFVAQTTVKGLDNV